VSAFSVKTRIDCKIFNHENGCHCPALLSGGISGVGSLQAADETLRSETEREAGWLERAERLKGTLAAFNKQLQSQNALKAIANTDWRQANSEAAAAKKVADKAADASYFTRTALRNGMSSEFIRLIGQQRFREGLNRASELAEIEDATEFSCALVEAVAEFSGKPVSEAGSLIDFYAIASLHDTRNERRCEAVRAKQSANSTAERAKQIAAVSGALSPRIQQLNVYVSELKESVTSSLALAANGAPLDVKFESSADWVERGVPVDETGMPLLWERDGRRVTDFAPDGTYTCSDGSAGHVKVERLYRNGSGLTSDVSHRSFLVAQSDRHLPVDEYRTHVVDSTD
jgi:hypothetical protein